MPVLLDAELLAASGGDEVVVLPSAAAFEHPERVARLVALGGVGLALFSPSPPEGIKLLVEFVEDPTLERLVAWMESMVYDSAILTDEFVQQRWKAATAVARRGDGREGGDPRVRRDPLVRRVVPGCRVRWA